MADNTAIRNAAGVSVNAATDELSDGAFSPKVTMLSGAAGSPTPIDPRHLTHLPGEAYETVAASATNQALGTTGATGDLLNQVWIIPATTSPGAVSIKDGGGSAITIFTGGATSVSNLVPFVVSLGIVSAAGAWSVTTGTNVSVLATGTFTA